MQTIQPFLNLRTVYCAGPLFNEAERREMCLIAETLNRSGLKTFLPHADGMEFAKVQPVLISSGHDPVEVGRILHKAIFAMDVYQVVQGCGSMVFNMNGRVPDEGAVAEATMAWMLGKPVVIYKEDVRSMIAGRDNPLVVGQTDFNLVTRMDQLVGELEARIAAPFDASAIVPCPPHLAQTVELGRGLWERLRRLPPDRPEELVARIVFDIFVSHGPQSGPRGRLAGKRRKPVTEA